MVQLTPESVENCQAPWSLHYSGQLNNNNCVIVNTALLMGIAAKLFEVF